MFTHSHTRNITSQLLVLLMLFSQSALVMKEWSEMSNNNITEQPSHLSSSPDPADTRNLDYVGVNEATLECDDTESTCDNCHHCHGSHVSIITQVSDLNFPPSHQPDFNFTSLASNSNPSRIDRPPTHLPVI